VRVPIPFGRQTLELSISDEQMGQLLPPRSLPPLRDVRDALQEQLGSEYCNSVFAKIEKRVREDKSLSVAIVVNDYTRPTPLHAVLPPLLDVLNSRGVDDSRIRVVVALGTHRPMREEEFRRQAGEQVLRRVGFINPAIDDPARLCCFGAAASGVEVRVNRDYAEADFKIAVGTILPHGAVGFSGGAKLIYPGIAGRKTVENFHAAANSDPENRAGRLDSPIRGEIEKLVELVGLDLMINLVVDAQGNVCGLTAGHYIDSHRRAVPQARWLYGLPLSRPSSVLVAGSAPADLDFWQAAKAIFNCQEVVEDGGRLVLVTPCPEGIPAEHKAFDRAIGLAPAKIEELLARLAGEDAGEFTVDPGMDRVTLAPALALSRFRQRIRIAVVSPGLTEAQVRRMGFDYFSTVEVALESILQGLPEAKRRVDVVTHGGSTYPCMEPEEER
jgi:nickel-dependent lactate racemase